MKIKLTITILALSAQFAETGEVKPLTRQLMRQAGPTNDILFTQRTNGPYWIEVYGSNRLDTVRILSNAPPADLTNAINWIVESGKFCEVRGHLWVSYLSAYAVYEPNVSSRRQCGNCKLIQTQRIGAWE